MQHNNEVAEFVNCIKYLNLPVISSIFKTVLENYRCDGCQRLNTSTKAVYITQLSGAVIIQVNILKFIGVINKKVTPNLSIDEEIVLWGNTMVLSGVVYHEG